MIKLEMKLKILEILFPYVFMNLHLILTFHIDFSLTQDKLVSRCNQGKKCNLMYTYLNIYEKRLNFLLTSTRGY